MKQWHGLKVIVIGAARQGLALARYLTSHGARVVLNDQRPAADLALAQEMLAGVPDIEWVCGGHPLSILDGADLVCPSGGVPLTLPLLQEAARRGIPLSNDSQIFLEAAPCKVIGITGSAGKTTTTTLVGRMGQASLDLLQEPPYRKVWVGGNIGSPLILVVDEMGADDLAIMELSSFQLEIMSLSPQVAAVLNVTPNHLDRHGTMEAYRAAKARIVENQQQQDVVVLGRDDPGAWSLRDRAPGRVYSFGLTPLPQDQPGAYFSEQAIYLHLPGNEAVRLIEQDRVALRGEHNLVNVMAASAIAAAAGLPVEAVQAGVTGFRGVPHRLEFVRTWGGADWYNDSIATAPERSMAAIRSFTEPLILLAGGRDKNLPWGDFADLVRSRVDHLILFGEAIDIILNAMQPDTGTAPTVTRCTGLKQAVLAAASLVQPGDVVLLSPGGTSFDEFTDFEERGECFAKWVRELR